VAEVSAHVLPLNVSPKKYPDDAEEFCASPTATQSPVEKQVTEVSSDQRAPFGLGVDIGIHVLPFHCSTTASAAVAEVSLLPTAKQLAAVTQETLFRATPVAGTGLAAGEYDVPFQCSRSAEGVCPENRAPTTQQSEAELHAPPTRAAEPLTDAAL
jgi:hypothetical protein